MTSPFPHDGPRLADDAKTTKRLELNHRRNRAQDHTAKLDAAAAAFDYAACKDVPWNPDDLALLWGTPLWAEASAAQRVVLNQLYWVAYYAQIVSAEIATIFYNQTSAAGLYQLEGFRLVCDTLDLESAQERAHIAAFKRVGEAVEHALFGERVFTYPMRGPFAETMIFADAGPFRAWWKRLQLRTFGLLSSGNAFIACQYFTVRGLRTLNGKIAQGRLAAFAQDLPDAPLPARISDYHFQDESYHFNSSMLISQDVLRSLRPPTRFEALVANMALRGCQRDHRRFSAAINGIFWHDPALYPKVYRVLRAPCFGLDHAGALDMLRRCFCEDSEGLRKSAETHRTAVESYKRYLEGLPHVTRENREMSIIGASSVERVLAENRRGFARFARTAGRLRDVPAPRPGAGPAAEMAAAATEGAPALAGGAAGS